MGLGRGSRGSPPDSDGWVSAAFQSPRGPGGPITLDGFCHLAEISTKHHSRDPYLTRLHTEALRN